MAKDHFPISILQKNASRTFEVMIEVPLNLSPEDLLDLEQRGITPDELKKQLQYFVHGFPRTELVDFCTDNNGIVLLDEAKQREYVSGFEQNRTTRLAKFVPASGAASRMFGFLFSLLNNVLTPGERDQADRFFEHLKQFAFWSELAEHVEGYSPDDQRWRIQTAKSLLEKRGLGYGMLPKGSVAFHRYGSKVVTAFEEHLEEGAACFRDANNTVRIHFTLLPEHVEEVSQLLKAAAQKMTSDKLKFEISYSVQNPSTDTIAVNLQNQPLRDKSGRLIFRPGGHGALLKNLEETDGDIVFVKNIDNVIPTCRNELSHHWIKVLGGMLLSLRNQSFNWINRLEKGGLTQIEIEDCKDFLRNELHVDGQIPAENVEAFLFDRLNRPLRICGMVRNQGEPGGGPFWVRNSKGMVTPQIVEKAQIDISDQEQEEILRNSTHFNPVDLVCNLTNHKGQRFNLMQYRDENAGFIAHKKLKGLPIKALEIPGLWNGSMAFWNSVFVEVPAETFQPVKTVNDLLRSAHRPCD